MFYRVIVCAILLVFCCSCAQLNAPGTAITNVTLIDAVNGVRANQTVVFESDRISWVGPADKAPPSQTQVDGTGKFLIPGLWDMHVHLTYNNEMTSVMPASFLRYGVTSVRDTGGLLEKVLPVVEDMRKPGTLAPRVFFSGPLLDGNYVVYDGVASPEIGVQNAKEAQAVANVARLKSAGASFIKIYEMVSPGVFKALTEAAQDHNLPIAAHVPLSMLASDAGPHVGSMEHLRNIELDCAENWKEMHAERLRALTNEEARSGGELRSFLHRSQRYRAMEALDEDRCRYVIEKLTSTIQVPTIGMNAITLYPIFERADWPAALANMPQSIQEAWQSVPSWMPADKSQWDTQFPTYVMTMVKTLHDAGVPIGAGTDTPIAHSIPGYSLLHELEVLTKAGLTPLEAIASATLVPATFFNLESTLGSIDVDKHADLVLLNANPLTDIANLHQISQVFARGIAVPR